MCQFQTTLRSLSFHVVVSVKVLGCIMFIISPMVVTVVLCTCYHKQGNLLDFIIAVFSLGQADIPTHALWIPSSSISQPPSGAVYHNLSCLDCLPSVLACTLHLPIGVLSPSPCGFFSTLTHHGILLLPLFLFICVPWFSYPRSPRTLAMPTPLCPAQV